jgi:NAD(P)-dependent dehydrogenase (short-subunit alcohol dehydrogenase family)
MNVMVSETLFPSGAALIVGGSGGIGRCVCQEFANAGSDVALTYRSQIDVAEKTAVEIQAQGRRASIHSLDTLKDGSIEAVIESVIEQHGAIHTVVYGAAPLTEQLYISEFTRERWKTAIDQEVHGFFNVVHATLPLLRKNGGGSYVHLGSAGHRWWPERDGLSVIPKAANEALIQGIAKEEGKYGIRANTVLVGVIEAGMFLELTKQGVFDQRWIDETHKLLAIKRWGRPEEIGYAATFLASDRARYITGQVLSVSGGFGV